MNHKEPREWMRIERRENGLASITCTLHDGTTTVKWTVKAYSSTIATEIPRARAGARQALADAQREMAAFDVE